MITVQQATEFVRESNFIEKTGARRIDLPLVNW
jgi:hypothetical protein